MRDDPQPTAATPWWIDLVALGVLLSVSAIWTIHLWSRVPGAESGEPHRIYTTESAIQFRYLERVAHGESIPETDTALEWPEGIHPVRDLAIFMEAVEGRLLRWLGWQDEAATRIVWLAMIIYALRLIPLYITARLLWRSPWAAIASTTLYAAFFPGYGRVIGSYGREHFALPFLLTGLLLGWLAVVRDDDENTARSGWLLTLASAVGWAVALASWHLTRSLFLLHVLGLAVATVLLTPRRGLLRLLSVTLALAALAGLLSPMLSARGFLLSPPVLALALTTLCALLLPRLGPARPVRAGALLLIAGAVLLGRTLAPDDSHVTALLVAKIRMLGQLPDDPTQISFEARSLWIEAFQSPTAYVWLYVYGPLTALGVYGLITLARRKTDRLALWVLLAGCGVFAGAFLLVTRMGVFWSPLLALAAGALALRLPDKKTVAPWLAILLVLCLDVYRSAYYHTRGDRLGSAVASVLPQMQAGGVPVLKYEQERLLTWIRRNTAADDALVARFALSPTLLLASERPIVLHSKFETPGIRKAVETFLTSVYASEADFARWCRERRATWVVVEPEWTLESGPLSMPYMAGFPAAPADSAAFRLFFLPETITHFELQYQNSHYRVYRVLAEGETPSHLTRPVPQALFELSTYNASPAQPPSAEEMATGLQHLLEARALWQQGLLLYQQGRIQECGDTLAAALRQYRGLPIARSLLATLLLQRGDIDNALSSARNATLYEPDVAHAWIVLGTVLQAAGKTEEAREAFETAHELDPNDPRPAQALATPQHQPE